MSFHRVSRLLAVATMAAVLGLTSQANAQEADVAKPVEGTPLPYQNVKADDPEIQQIWKGWGDGYLDQNDDMRVIWLAHIKDAKGRDVTVSQIGSLSVCGATSCPSRIMIGGELVAETMVCDAQDYHVLVPSKGAVFFCDIAIPLETEAEKAAAGRK